MDTLCLWYYIPITNMLGFESDIYSFWDELDQHPKFNTKYPTLPSDVKRNKYCDYQEKWAIQAWYWITHFCFIEVIYFWLLLFWPYMKLCVCPELCVCAMSCSLPSVCWGTILDVSNLIIVISHRTCIFCATERHFPFFKYFFTYNESWIHIESQVRSHYIH